MRFLSITGCVYVAYRLHRIKYETSFSYWRTRHYLIFILTCTNFAMSLSALISGFFYLVFGRLASVPGCTISGMTEFWAQQAVDVSIVIVALAVLASVYSKNLWMRHRHWIQTNMAPVFGIVLFLPLVFTVASQIIWRFRSSEFAYCWIPRHPVYARWVAIEGWRVLIILGLIASYVRIVYTIRASKRNPNMQISWPMNGTRKSKRRYSAIDSGMVSRVTNDPRGLFSQSVYNINRWARSKIGRTNNTDNASANARGLAGLRNGSQDYSHPMGDSSFYKVQYLSDNNIHSDDSTSAVFYTGRHRNSTTLSVVRGPKTYYEQFKRSFVNNIARHFNITTDIPSPTIPQSIFDRIAKNPHECADPTLCDYCYSSETPGHIDSKLASADNINASSKGQTRVLKRWYSALTGLLSKPSKAPSVAHNSAQLAVYNLRRSHTAPVFTSEKASVCNQMFRRPLGSPAATDSVVSYENNNDNDADIDDQETKYGVTSQDHTLIMTEYYSPLSRFRNFDVKKRQEPNNDSSVLPDDAYLNEKIHRIFGASVEIPSHAIHRVSIHTSGPACPMPARTSVSAPLPPQQSSTNVRAVDGSNDTRAVGSSESPSLSTCSHSSSPQKAHVENPSSLEEGHWTSAVERCRIERQSQLDLAEKNPKPRISRLYVYPLAYVVIWLPSIVYYVMSTYVYYSAFESPGHHWKKSLDFSGLPASWTEGQNMNRAWPYLTRIAENVPGSRNIGWMAIVQSLHMLSGAVDAVLFWLTE
ncbi:hypothetical protein H4R99_005849 [Coemansia sp. RSA 1722]|nr:hypothetical protein H4R99_005849 [Coemansia sp. RSA 1722]